MKKMLLKVALIAFIGVGASSLLNSPLSAQRPVCHSGYDFGCAMGCAFDVYDPCRDSGGSVEFCTALQNECLVPSCCL